MIGRQIAASVFALGLILLPAFVYAQSAGGTDFSYNQISGPVFVDAFWTDRTTPPPATQTLNKVEVGPGEGPSILAVTLTNRGLSQITSITGDMSLPQGFKASGTVSSVASASQSGIIQPGDSFTLFFQIDVGKEAAVGSYTGSLQITYSRVVETGNARQATLDVPFRVTGKVILSAESTGQLSPGTSSPFPITISNIGSADASAVVVTLNPTGPSNLSSTIAGIGSSTFDLGTIPVGGSSQITPLIYASNTAADTLQVASMQVSYRDAYGIKQTQTLTVGIVVLPKSIQSELSIAAETNNGSNSIVAGKIFDYRFMVTNNSDKPLSDLLVTLGTPSTTLMILNDSKWTVQTLAAGAKQEFRTEVFAPTTMIGSPVSFNISVKYLASGESRTEAVTVGSYVDGDISLRAYEVGVSYIGGIPNVIGNLLNEGNTRALFTAIDLTNTGGLTSSLPPQQYLGDLDENSPLPFSIPVDINKGASAGNYPVSLKVTYKDSLRQTHTFEVTQTVNFAPQSNSTQTAQATSGIGSMAPVIIIAIIVIAAIIVAVSVMRRRKSSTLKQRFESRKESNIESVLDSHRLEKRPDDRK